MGSRRRRARQETWGYARFAPGNYPEAIRGLSQALEENPQIAPVRAMLGMAYFATDKYADAAKTFAPLGSPGNAGSQRRLCLGCFAGADSAT